MYKVPLQLIRKREGSSINPRTKWCSDDVIAIMLASLKTDYITTNESKIHGAVFELKEKYPDFFNDLIFSGTKTHPFSKELERILFRFYQSNILSTLNPSFDVYFIDEPKKKYIIQHLKGRFSAIETDKINKMSALIESEKLLSI